MMEIAELRSQLSTVSPVATLEKLAQILSRGTPPEDFENPSLMVQMRSGASHKGFLIGQSKTAQGHFFTLSLTIKSISDDGRDVVYLNGADIESVTVFDIDRIVSLLAGT